MAKIISYLILAALLIYPAKLESGQLYLKMGLGLSQSGNLETHKAVEEDEGAENPLREKNRLVWKYEYSGQTVGIHAGVGANLAIMPPIFLSLEFLYRKAEFKDFKTSSQQIRGTGWGPFFAHQMNETGEQWGGDSTFLYAQKIKIEDSQRDIDYSVARYDSSGFIMRVGIKFRF
jgi:hypothetical protein